MAIEAFLKLGDLKGESLVKGFEDHIQLLSWNWELSQVGTTHIGSGGGAGKVNVKDLTFESYVDMATPPLLLACCKGTHYPQAVLTQRKAGGNPLTYLTITLKDVLVTHVAEGGGTSDELQTQSVSLNFASFEVSYQPQDNKGAKRGGAINVQYDIARNA